MRTSNFLTCLILTWSKKFLMIQKVSAPQMAILKSTKSLNLFLAGVGSGKTFVGGIISYRFVRKFPKVRGFIGANTYLQLTQSTLFRIREY